MDINPIEVDRYHRSEAIDRFGGSLVNVILGALILWVGQTCFRHAGLLASVDERFEITDHHFETMESKHEMLRQRLEQVTTNTADRTRSRFTREDGEKMGARIKELQELQGLVERQLTERLTSLQLKVIALETSGNNYQEVAMLHNEVQRLRTQVSGQSANPYYRSASGSAASQPTYLPPVSQNR